jgi:hypothetical protein
MTSRGTKRPEGQNVWREKTSGRPNVHGNKTSGRTKRPEGQNVWRFKTSRGKTSGDIQIKNIERNKTTGDTTSFWINFNKQYLQIKNFNNNTLLNNFQVYYSQV